MNTERLEQAIHDAVAATAAPDESRLAALLARLEQAPISRPSPRRSVWPWLLLLAAAGVAAAGGGYWYAQQITTRTQPKAAGNGVTAIDPMPVTPPSPTAAPSAAPDAVHENGEQHKNTAIIYRQ